MNPKGPHKPKPSSSDEVTTTSVPDFLGADSETYLPWSPSQP